MHRDRIPQGGIRFVNLVDNGDGTMRTENVRVLSIESIKRCPFFIFDPSHYRDDGSCMCDDAEHREFMKRRWGYSDEDFLLQ